MIDWLTALSTLLGGKLMDCYQPCHSRLAVSVLSAAVPVAGAVPGGGLY